MKPTKSEIIILHIIVSTALASIVGVLDVSAQYYYQHNLDLWQTLLFAGPTLVGSFGAMRLAIWHAVQASPALPQAEQDLAQQALAEVRNLAASVSTSVLPFMHQHPAPAQPPSGPVVSRAVTTPAARAQAPQPIVFPQSGASPISFGDTGQMPAMTPTQQ